MKIYLKLNGTQVGPYKIEDVQGWIRGGYYKMEDPARFEDSDEWITVSDIPGVDVVKGGHTIDGHLIPPFDAYDGDKPYLFISYAHKDSALVFKEISKLNDAGYHIWYDEGIEASSEWPEEIANAVIGCAVFVVFISPRSTASVNCRNEINLALNENKPFLAVYLEDSELPPGLRLRMGDLQAILKYKLPLERYQKKLDEALNQLLGNKKKNSSLSTKSPETKEKIKSQITLESKTEEKIKPNKKSTKDLMGMKFKQVDFFKEKKKILWFGLAAVLATFLIGSLFQGSENADQDQSTPTFVEGKPWTVPSISLEMLWCEPGVFYTNIFSQEKGKKESIRKRRITLTKGFFLGEYEVTQEQWKSIMGTSPSKFFGPNRPVERITWEEAKRFCQELTLIEMRAGRIPEGWVYDLPTEAQWEYACRAGTDTKFYWGDEFESEKAKIADGKVNETLKVGQYPPNRWGFYDMIGNVNEWCSDWYSKLYSQPILDPVGPEQGKEKTFRGGGLFDSNKTLDPSRRNKKGNMYRNAGNGFRLCLKESVVKKVEGPVLEKAWSVPSIGMEMLWCNPGTFNVGSPEDEIGRGAWEDLREVTFDNGFYLGKFEVKQSEFNDIMGYHPETKYIGNNLPALNVSWSEAVEFCDKLTALEAKRGRLPEGWFFTLPSEDQWEYAARAGTNSAYHWGGLIEPKRANYKTMIRSDPMIVGSYDSNNWGFHDISGNALEWCINSRLRGGSWRSTGYSMRIAFRNHPTNLAVSGFRISLQKFSSILSDNKLFLDNGLVGWWKFDETKGKVANDSSGKKRNGNLKNFDSDTAQWTKGIQGNALRFDGKNDEIHLNPNDFKNIDWSGISVSSWAKHEFEINSHKEGFVLSISNKEEGSIWLRFNRNKTFPTINFFDKWTPINNKLILKREWFHFGFIYDGKDVNLFFNGKFLPAKEFTRENRSNFISINSQIKIGGGPDRSHGSWKGSIDDLRIYDRAITEVEVKALHAMGEASK